MGLKDHSSNLDLFSTKIILTRFIFIPEDYILQYTSLLSDPTNPKQKREEC